MVEQSQAEESKGAGRRGGGRSGPANAGGEEAMFTFDDLMEQSVNVSCYQF